jgi:hypothetical protein
MIVPKIVQMIILSLILQNIIDNKEILKKLQIGLIAAFYDRGKQKLLYDMVNTNDLNTFNKNVLDNKEKLFTLTQNK